VRRVLVFLVLALTLVLFPCQTPASVVKSAYAPEGVFYAWSDALGAPGGAGPKTTVRRLSGDTYTTVESEMWASDADCEAWSPGLPGKLDALLGELVGAGLNPELLRGLKVYLLPAYLLNLQENRENPGYGVSGLRMDGNSIGVAGLWWDAERVFLHELGHLVADKTLGMRGYDWCSANSDGREYLKLRSYPSGKPVNAFSQAELPWGDRAAEWFAEDFAYWAASRTGRYRFLDRYLAPCGPPDEKVLVWFDRVFLVKSSQLIN